MREGLARLFLNERKYNDDDDDLCVLKGHKDVIRSTTQHVKTIRCQGS